VIRNFTKSTTLILSYLTSILFAPIKKQKIVGVLMYHSVDETKWKYGISKKDFEKQLQYLQKNFNVVSAKKIIEYIQGKIELDNKSITLTFDDGYLNTYETVLPLLKKYNLPATIFLTTNLEEKPCLGNLPRPNWEQIKEMQKSGLVEIEVHGHNHKNLKNEVQIDAELENEILKCQKIIAEKIGIQPTLLAYASGHKNEKVIQVIQKQGFQAAFDISEGFVKKGDNLFRIKRIQVDRTMNFLLFKLRLTPALEYNRRFVDRLRKILK